MRLIINLSDHDVHDVQVHDIVTPPDEKLEIEVRDFDWPREGDLDSLPDDCEFISDSDGEYVRSNADVKVVS
jgi:hypothetical protein